MSRLDLSVLGSTGLRDQGGYIFEEFLTKLQGARGIKFLREMKDNDSTIGALLFAIEALVVGSRWRVESANDTPQARRWAEFMEEVLDDMDHTFEEWLMEILSMLWAGWELTEIIYKIRRGPQARDPRFKSKHSDGLVGWRKMPIRGQDTLQRWEIDAEGNILGMWQLDIYGTGGISGHGMVFIPIEKALLFRPSAHKNNPEGRPIIRNAVVDYHYKKRIRAIEAVGIERDMTGVIDMQVPMEILVAKKGTDANRIFNDLVSQLSGLKRDEREFIMRPPEMDAEGKPTGYALQLLSTGGKRQVDTNTIILRYDTSMLRSVMAEVLMLGGPGDGGSWALASEKTRLMGLGIGSIMDTIASVINRFGIARLMNLNRVPVDLQPNLVHSDIETPELDGLGNFIQAMTAAGFDLTEDPRIKRKLLEAATLPVEIEKKGPEKPSTRVAAAKGIVRTPVVPPPSVNGTHP